VLRAPNEPLRFQRPVLPAAERIEAYLVRSRELGWFSNGGPCLRLLTERIEARVGTEFVPVASGTTGLLAAVCAVTAVAPGTARRALVPSFTFPATAQAALWNGLEPRLIDVGADHWHMDPAVLEHELDAGAGSIAVVLAVSSFGTPPPVEVRQRWERACRDAGVPLIVDSAAGFGAVAADGCPIGAQGDIEVVSFHATKPFAIGEGGGVFTRDPELAERLRRTINFGLAQDHSVVAPLALNGKMSELHAATALAVLDELDAILDSRRAAARRIRARARPDLTWQRECERSTWQFVPVAFASRAARDAAIAAAAGRVETRVYYAPLHQMAAFARYASTPLPVTDDLATRLLALPMANDLSSHEVELVAQPLWRGLASERPRGNPVSQRA
jgi:dTDP-4-amino-4,6-dideoxygalactose transaminase